MATNRHEINREQFFELVRAGLWSYYHSKVLAHGVAVDWKEVYQLAEEQSVVGLVAAGMENLDDNYNVNIPLELKLQIIGEALQIEQQNKEMNLFVAQLMETLRKNDIYTLLVKGQGIAQCYERPLWRTSGDVDLLLSEENYGKACAILEKKADSAGRETAKNAKRMHQEYHIEGWTVELHGTMHSNLSRRIDRSIDEVQRDCFYGGSVRSWKNGGTQVYLPGPNEDVIFVFTHILQHLFLEGIGLRQICDWCRLLWTYRDVLDYGLLEKRLRKMGLMSEWRVLGTMAVKYLGMTKEAIPLLCANKRPAIPRGLSKSRNLTWKAKCLMDFEMEVGNFGHNRKVDWSDGFKRRTMLILHRLTDTIKLSRIFPIDAPMFLMNYMWDGVKGVVKR